MDNTGEGFKELALPAFAFPEDARQQTTRELSKKFSRVLTTANLTLEETISLGLAQVASVARALQCPELADTLPQLSIPPRLDFIFLPQFQVVCQELVQKVRRGLHRMQSVEEYLENTAKRFRVRVCLYSVSAEVGRVGKKEFECERSKCFTIHVFERNWKAALLVPKKYLLASRTEHAGLKQSVFITDSALEPPKVDGALQRNLAAHEELFTRTQQFAKPLLQYTVEVLSRLRETARRPGKSVYSYIREILSLAKKIDGREFGPDGKPMLTELAKVIKDLGPENYCNDCGEHAPDVSLKCGHVYCADCLKKKLPEKFLSVRGELLVRLACPYPWPYPCGGEISIEDLQRMDARYFESRVREHEEKAQLRLCKSCNCLHSLLAFSQLQCGHFVCTYCLAIKHSNTFTCPTCKSGAFQVNLSGDMLKGQCAWCMAEFQYKYTLPLTCYGTGDEIGLVHSELCNRCLFYCMKQGMCACKRQFSPKELDYLKNGVQVKAECHDGLVTAKDMFRQQSCGHHLCTQCVIARAPELACKLCGVVFDEGSYAKLEPCSLCQRPVGQIPLPCGHHVHQACVVAVVQQCEGENHAVCPTCRAYIPPSYMLQYLTDPQISSYFNDRFGYSFKFQCPYEKGEEILLEPLSTAFSWTACRCHGASMCAFCLQTKQERRMGPEDTHSCPFLARRELVDKMLSRSLNVAQCPYCWYPAVEQESEHLQCTECKHFFEACCCAATEAVQGHGAAWHRPNCKNYVEQAKSAGLTNCALCRSGPPCPKPQRLQRPRLIGPRERFQ